ncbi:unnamed protein product [Rhizoctonia solani]|uniref:N-acetyltransferase domain-containing protein n=1 Tax=Rhizoctonia solani TaxID=456999 RepID=A0A8H2XNV8_9AGAM|nr:unnamed protein product [Rhizoctonia solani]
MTSRIEYDELDAASTVDAATEQNSAASVFSFSSSRDGSAMLREAEGRIFNSQNELYYLPAGKYFWLPYDELEYSRLDKQHLVHLLMNDGLVHRNVATKVRAVLDPGNITPDGSPRRVLDLGCGGGNWAISMALEFPHAEVVGVDLAPNTSRPPPPNCRFEFDDFNLGMSHYYGMFDVIHARSAANGVTNFREFMNDMGLCLRPGGLILVVEGDLELFSYTREPQEIAYGDGDRNKSWMARMLFEAFSTMKSRGSHVDANANLYNWLCQNPLFEAEDWGKLFTPIGPWERGRTTAETNKLQIIGELMRQNSLAFVRALKPLLISEGYAPEIVDRFIAGTDRELSELSIHMYVKWHYAWAVRKEESDSGLIPVDERLAQAESGSVATPSTSTISVVGSPLTMDALSNSNQSILGGSGENGMSITPSTGGLERMSDVELWAAQNSGVVAAETDSGSEHGSEEEFIDADSDGDINIEDVTDAVVICVVIGNESVLNFAISLVGAVEVMSVLRPFRATDLFKFNNINLDVWTETYSISFYLSYLAKWPELCAAEISPSGQMMGYVIGKAEGVGIEWHGHVTAITVAPEYRRLSVARRMMDYLERISDQHHNGNDG